MSDRPARLTACNLIQPLAIAMIPIVVVSSGDINDSSDDSSDIDSDDDGDDR